MKVAGGVPCAPPRAPPRPPPPRPRAAPISLPPHQTPDRSGWPSPMRGTGPAGALFDDAVPPSRCPPCAAAEPVMVCPDHVAATAAIARNEIAPRFMFETFLYFRLGITARPAPAGSRTCRRQSRQTKRAHAAFPCSVMGPSRETL